MKVDSLPLSINGENLYQFPYQKDKRLKAVADGRAWDRDMSVKWKGAENDSVRAQHCKGSYKCKNPKCSFKQQHGKANNLIQFEKSLFPVLLEVHGVPARPSRGSCLLLRYTHTCQTKRRVLLPSVVEQSLQRNPNLKPSEVVRQSILEGLKTDVVNWHELEKTTDSLLDTNIKFQI